MHASSPSSSEEESAPTTVFPAPRPVDERPQPGRGPMASAGTMGRLDGVVWGRVQGQRSAAEAHRHRKTRISLL